MFVRVWLLWLALLPATALADGGFIPATVFEKVRIPDQRALIHFDKGQETLVIDTSFQGDGTNFAWLIPVPSVPTVEPATTGLFSTLQILFQPRIVHDVFAFYGLIIFVGFVVAYGLWKGRRGESIIPGLLFLAFLSVISGMLLPALSPASSVMSRAGDSAQVEVLERKRVGAYDTAILSSRDGQAVFDWLKANGFVAPTNFIPVIRGYAQENWCFVASKLALGTSQPQGAKAHPLVLRFAAARPVYPLRLTGINNESCRIELYVFGPSRAESPNFKVHRCVAPSYPKGSGPVRRLGEDVRIRHPLLRKFVGGSPAATKLVGNLSSQQMRQDAYFNWTPLSEERMTLYSRKGAAIVASNIATPLAVVGLLGLLVCHWAGERELPWSKKARRVCSGVFLAALVLWGTVYLWLPKARVVASRLPGLRMEHLLGREVPAELRRLQLLETQKGRNFTPNAAWVRQQLLETADLRRAVGDRAQTNLFTGERWHEEDSPGNYTVHDTPAGLDYAWYDLEGGENVVDLFAESRRE